MLRFTCIVLIIIFLACAESGRRRRPKNGKVIHHFHHHYHHQGTGAVSHGRSHGMSPNRLVLKRGRLGHSKFRKSKRRGKKKIRHGRGRGSRNYYGINFHSGVSFDKGRRNRHRTRHLYGKCNKVEWENGMVSNRKEKLRELKELNRDLTLRVKPK